MQTLRCYDLVLSDSCGRGLLLQQISLARTRLVILSTHPIQYHAPWFRAVAAESLLEVQVWFCHKASPREQADAGFGVEFDWDTSLLDGYEHRFLQNVSP